MVELLPNGYGTLHRILGVDQPQGIGSRSNAIPLIARAEAEISRLMWVGYASEYDWWKQSVKDRPQILLDPGLRYGLPEDRPKILFPDAKDYKTEMGELEKMLIEKGWEKKVVET